MTPLPSRQGSSLLELALSLGIAGVLLLLALPGRPSRADTPRACALAMEWILHDLRHARGVDHPYLIPRTLGSRLEPELHLRVEGGRAVTWTREGPLLVRRGPLPASPDPEGMVLAGRPDVLAFPVPAALFQTRPGRGDALLVRVRLRGRRLVLASSGEVRP